MGHSWLWHVFNIRNWVIHDFESIWAFVNLCIFCSSVFTSAPFAN